jgi:hypothetical protein
VVGKAVAVLYTKNYLMARFFSAEALDAAAISFDQQVQA